MTQVSPASNHHNIQLPKQMVYNDGESVVKKSSGLIRVRKGQSEDEYLEQRNSFWQTGPVIQNHTFVTEYVEKLIEKKIDNNYVITEHDKIERETVLHGLERLYYQRQYDRCLKDVQKIKFNLKLDSGLDLDAKKNKNLKRIVNELDILSKRCVDKLQQRNETKLKDI